MIKAFILVASLGVGFVSGQTAVVQKPSGVVRLWVRVKQSDTDAAKGLSRKRFFLVRGTLEQNHALISAINQQPLVTRDCYYSRLGASSALINWLKESDCESVYCRAIEQEYLSGAKAVPEFVNAFATSVKDFGSDVTARKWLSTNLPANLRDGFYRDRQSTISALVKIAEANSGTVVQSVMTDRNGTAYFTELEPGTYVLSNLVPTQIGESLATWNCEIRVKPDDISMEKSFQISNKAARNVKCVAVEKPLPACEKQ